MFHSNLTNEYHTNHQFRQSHGYSFVHRVWALFWSCSVAFLRLPLRWQLVNRKEPLVVPGRSEDGGPALQVGHDPSIGIHIGLGRG